MLTKGMLPSSWLRYKVPTSCSVAAFSNRVKQLSNVSNAVVLGGGGASKLKIITVWMGGETGHSSYL